MSLQDQLNFFLIISYVFGSEGNEFAGDRGNETRRPIISSCALP